MTNKQKLLAQVSKTKEYNPKIDNRGFIGTMFRMPKDLHKELYEAALTNRRSLNSEMLLRLIKSLP